MADARYFHRSAALLALAALPLVGCSQYARQAIATESAAPARQPSVLAWCGVHPDDPYVTAKVAAIASTGVVATFGPCNAPDWSTYSPATPGQRYSDPSTYLRLLELNAAAGLRTFVYDARLWDDDPQVRADALTAWKPHTRWIAGWDMSDEWDEGQWPELARRWTLVYGEATHATGVEPFTNNLPWMIDRAVELEGDRVSFDDYNVTTSLATVAKYEPIVPHLTCAVNGITHGSLVATPASLRDALRRHLDAGCDSLILFGGDRPISTPGFDHDSIITQAGELTPLGVALRAVVVR